MDFSERKTVMQESVWIIQLATELLKFRAPSLKSEDRESLVEVIDTHAHRLRVGLDTAA